MSLCKHVIFRAVVFASLFILVFCVPPSPTDNLIKDVADINKRIQNIEEQLEKWNIIYKAQIEPRIISTATILSNIDANIKNLQERAHVWDTFQLHVAAWNEQLSSSDRKLDIISKGQEKLINIDSKLNLVENVEYKIDNIKKQMEISQENISSISKKLDDPNFSRDALFGEFATRGILSTLKQIERKIDKVQVNSLNRPTKLEDDLPGRMTIKCNTPPIVEELLTDMSSKVDTIFDKLSAKYEDEFDNDEYLDDQSNNKVVREARIQDDEKLLKKIVRRLNLPCKEMSSELDDLKRVAKTVSNNTIVILENQEIYFKKTEKSCSTPKFISNEGLLLKLDQILNYMNYSDISKDRSLDSHFQEQRKHFESILDKNMPIKVTTPQTIVHECIHNYEDTSTVKYDGYIETSEDDCSQISSENAKTTVFKLGSRSVRNYYGIDFFQRYCEQVDGEMWTVIQNRGNFYGTPTNFSKDWKSYKYGFGNLSGEFWFGNDYIHKLTRNKDQRLRVILEDFEGNKVWAEYNTFWIDAEENNYRLTIGQYHGNASDSLTSHNGAYFSTYDRKNDEAPDCCPCSLAYGGGWWFNSCFEANLNGEYYLRPITNEYFRGIIWEHWLGNYSLKKTKMMIRPKINYVDSTTDNDFNTIPTTPPFIEDP